MARKSQDGRFARLEGVGIGPHLASKLGPLIEQMVMEQCVELNAALTFQVSLLEADVKELKRRLDRLDPQPALYAPANDSDSEADDELLEETPQDCWEDTDEEPDDEIPF